VEFKLASTDFQQLMDERSLSTAALHASDPDWG